MFTPIFKQTFPRWLAFSLYDYGNTEENLQTSELFAREELSLLCSVPAIALHRAEDESQIPECSNTDILDLLICRRDEALLAVVSQEREDFRAALADVPDLPYIYVSQEDMTQGNCEAVLEYLADTILKQPVRWRCRLQPIPDERVDDLLACRALHWRDCMLQPTEYGAARGLVRRLAPNEPDAVLCEPLWFECLFRMQETIRDRSVPTKLVDLDTRLRHHKAALCADYALSAKLFQQLADTPLERYMGDRHPEQLDLLRHHLVSQCETIRDAALAIQQLLTSGQEAHFDIGVTLLKALATPVRDYAMGQAFFRNWKRKPPARPNTSQLEQQRARWAASGHRPGLNELIRCQQSTTPTGAILARLPLTTFFQGLAAHTGLDYPLWLSCTMHSFFRAPTSFSYAAMISQAHHWLDSSMNPPWLPSSELDSPLDDAETGLYVLYLLLVEPFCLSGRRVDT